MSELPSKDRWFIDIRGQVRPVTTTQILQGLLSGEFKVIYRISRDRTNWKAICNETYFDGVIQGMIKKISAEVTRYGVDKAGQGGVSEQSGFHNLANIGSSINEQLEHAKNLQEMNLQLQGLRELGAEIVAKRKIVVDLSQEAEKDEIHPDDQNEMILAPTFFERFKMEFSWSNVQGRQKLVAILLFVALVSLFVTKYVQRQHEKLTEETARQAQEALRAKALGEYDRAVVLFGDVKDLSTLDSKTLLEIAQAHVEAKKYDSGAALLNKIIEMSKSPSDIAQAKSLLGHIAIKKNNYEAASSYYEESIKSEPVYSALYNLAIVNLFRNEPQQAETLLLKAYEMPGHDKGPVLLALFETAMLLDRREQKASKDNTVKPFVRLEKVNALLAQATDPLDPYHDENLAARIAIAAARNRPEDFNGLTAQWLNLDFRKTIVKKTELDLDYDRTSWAHIYDWCLDVYKDTNVGVIKSAFFAGCVARAKSAIEALPYAQFAADHLLADADVRGYLGYLVFLTGNLDGAKQVLRGGELPPSVLTKNTLTEICEKQPDAECNAPKIMPAPAPKAQSKGEMKPLPKSSAKKKK